MNRDVKRLVSIVNRFKNVPMTVVGDLVADRYIFGTAGRVSREAPVLIIDIENEELRLGGAANTAANMTAMGAKVSVIGVVGDDMHGDSLLEKLEQNLINTDAVVKEAGRQTITKTRVMAGDVHAKRQQAIRIDRGKREPLAEKTASKLKRLISELANKNAAIAFSDYGFGIAGDRVLDALREAAKKTPVVADSRFDLLRMTGMTAVAPNEPECEAALATRFLDEDDLRKAGAALIEKLGLKYALITRGNKGMALYQPKKKPFLAPIAKKHEAVDVTGAGDTVVAAFTLALAVGADPEDAVVIANHAAGVAVLHSGAVAVSAAEIIESLSSENG